MEPLRIAGSGRVAVNLAVFVASGIGLAVAQTVMPTTPDMDKRMGVASPIQLTPQRQAAADQLQMRFPSVAIDYDRVTGSPNWIWSNSRFLSGPDSEDEILHPRVAGTSAGTVPQAPDPYRAIKTFLDENRALFEHGAEILSNAVVIRDYVTPHNGMRTLIWEQRLDGIPVFDVFLKGHITQRGELANISSQFLPNIENAAGLDTTSRSQLELAPPISAQQAVANAISDVGENTAFADILPDDSAAAEPAKGQSFKADPLFGSATASLVWLPMNRTTVRLCWCVSFVRRATGEGFRSVVDASTGEVSVRQNQTCRYSNASYRVFTSDSAAPMTPGLTTPSTAQAPTVSPSLVTLAALSQTASPNGWINDGDNQTVGNNVDASLNRLAVDPNPTPRVQGSIRVFDFPPDLSQDPSNSTNENASVVNLFYWCNWMHDRLYDLGFTDQAGGYQGNTKMTAYAQFGAGLPTPMTNNSAFTFGGNGNALIEMFLFTCPPVARDATLDAEVILHEYTHGLSSRLVKSIPPFAVQTRGMGEGWSDFYALSMLSQPGDNVDASYPFGGYITYYFPPPPPAPCPPQTIPNYYFGGRRYPYSTDTNYNPLTFRDIDTNQISAHTGVPVNPNFPFVYQQTNAFEEHFQGEVWCVTLWEARANLIDRYGPNVGNDLIMRIVMDGMKLAPGAPNFIQARDAILQADLVDTGGAEMYELWAAFAKRGMGTNALSPPSTTTSGVMESYFAPGRGTQKWSYTMQGAVSSSPAVRPDGTVYVGAAWPDNHLYAINSDGTLKWTFAGYSGNWSFNSSPAIGPDGTIYVGCYDTQLYALNSDGTQKWVYDTGGQIFSSPAIGSDGTIYFGAVDDLKVYALNPNGTLKWSKTTGNTVYSSPALSQDGTVIYIGSMDGKVYALDAATGADKPGWPYTTGGYVYSSPAVGSDGTVYVGSFSGTVYALRPNGTAKWAYYAGGAIYSSPAIGRDGTIYVGSDNNSVYALDPNTGAVKTGWPVTTGYSVLSSPAVALDGTVFVGSRDDKVYAFKPDGTPYGGSWPFYTGGAVFSSPEIGLDGTIYVGSDNGKLYALSGIIPPVTNTWPMFRQNSLHTGNINTNAWNPTVSLPFTDTNTHGNWKDVGYGADGTNVIMDAVSYPADASLTALGKSDFVWNSAPTETRALERAGTGRIAACWYSGTSFDVVLSQTGGLSHIISLYFLDWDTTSRAQTVEIRNSLSGAVLDRQTVSAGQPFHNGLYLYWRIAGSVTIHITRTGGANAVLSGVFFSS